MTTSASNLLPEVKYNLWFYRFSCMECISCLFCLPFLIRILFSFEQIHTDAYTYVSWDNYLMPAAICGHYMVDINEVISHGYTKRSRDLLAHHFIALFTFGYHLFSLMNFRWITLIFFVELNSFFNRANLILKFHDEEKRGLLFNLSNLMNFLTMFFIRLTIYARLLVYDIFSNIEFIPAFLIYFIYIFLILLAMIYLAWTSLRYMLFTDLICVKLFLMRFIPLYGA